MGQRIQMLLVRAQKEALDLIVFPELALTPYFARWQPEELPAEIFPLVAGPEQVDALSQMVGDYGVAAVVPMARLGPQGALFNSAAVFNAQGQLVGFYDKVHLPPTLSGAFAIYERQWFAHGATYPVFDIGGVGRIGVQICYDRHFPEGFAQLRAAGAEVVALCSNSPLYGSQAEWRRTAWKNLCRVRAFENRVGVIAACKAGNEYGWDYIGHSLVVDSAATVLAEAQTDGDELVVAAVHREVVGGKPTTASPLRADGACEPVATGAPAHWCADVPWV
jgi:predicted amidohydrolase